MAGKDRYEKLLSNKRSRITSYEGRDLITEAESDRARLIFCPAFRRLQQKAQVFSMEPNAAVRSRLTHSLEVSQVGRYIAELIVKKLNSEFNVDELKCRAIVKFVENACLMHDIGNPPFGHFGEAAISKWFEENGHALVRTSCKEPMLVNCHEDKDPRVLNALYDFFSFDGNPQGLRVVTKLQRNNDEFGLNLTYTTLASYLKYVRKSDPSDKDKFPFTKKCGFFNTEEHLVNNVWGSFEYAKPQRYPLAYIMEAADDLAYCISDFEDSMEKGLLNQKNAFEEIRREWKKRFKKELNTKTKSVSSGIDSYFDSLIKGKRAGKDFTFIDFRTHLNREIVEYAAEEYIKNHEKILNGTLKSLIGEESVYGIFLEILKDFCRRKVYSHESVQRVELAGYKAIYGLLDHFKCLLSCEYERFQKALNYENNKDHKEEKIVIEKKLLRLFPKNYVKVYWDDVGRLDESASDFRFFEWNIRAHLIVDFISGMTDDFSMDTYRELSGMKL